MTGQSVRDQPCPWDKGEHYPTSLREPHRAQLCVRKRKVNRLGNTSLCWLMLSNRVDNQLSVRLFALNSISLFNREENIFPLAHLPELQLTSKHPAATKPNYKRYDQQSLRHNDGWWYGQCWNRPCARFANKHSGTSATDNR